MDKRTEVDLKVGEALFVLGYTVGRLGDARNLAREGEVGDALKELRGASADMKRAVWTMEAAIKALEAEVAP